MLTLLALSARRGPFRPAFDFLDDPLTFSSRQERLHKVGLGKRLWLVSREPEDSQHYIVGFCTCGSGDVTLPAAR